MESSKLHRASIIGSHFLGLPALYLLRPVADLTEFNELSKKFYNTILSLTNLTNKLRPNSYYND